MPHRWRQGSSRVIAKGGVVWLLHLAARRPRHRRHPRLPSPNYIIAAVLLAGPDVPYLRATNAVRSKCRLR